jgi:mono/diheme cytochrome c family protein
VILGGCQPEKRTIGPSPPVTPPVSDADPRAVLYQKNAWQIAQGGRLFAWYGCQGCHTDTATGALDLADDHWQNGGGLAQVWTSIAEGRADGMPAYAGRVPDEQIWQLTAYVRDQHKHARPVLRRQNADEANEPQDGPPSRTDG